MESYPFGAIVIAHIKRYPLMQPADLYKLAFQAAFGSEHALMSEEAARARLHLELTEMGDGPPEPLLDPLSPDGRLLRCHLRPYLKTGYDPEDLLQAFVRGAGQVSGGGSRLRMYLDAILYLAAAGQIGIDTGKLGELFAEMEAAGWPAAHHSQLFRQSYKPAYRVVYRELLPAGMSASL